MQKRPSNNKSPCGCKFRVGYGWPSPSATCRGGTDVYFVLLFHLAYVREMHWKSLTTAASQLKRAVGSGRILTNPVLAVLEVGIPIERFGQLLALQNLDPYAPGNQRNIASNLTQNRLSRPTLPEILAGSVCRGVLSCPAPTPAEC